MTLMQLAFDAVPQKHHLMLELSHTPEQFIIEIQIKEIINNYVEEHYKQLDHNDFFKFLAELHKTYYGKIPLYNHGIILVQLCRYYNKLIKDDMDDIILGMNQLAEYIYEDLAYYKRRRPIADIFFTPELEIVVSIYKGNYTEIVRINNEDMEVF